MRGCVRGTAAFVAVALFSAVAASSAGANTDTLGQIAPKGTDALCADCTTFQYSTDATSPSYRVPCLNPPCNRRSPAPAGDITAWRVRGRNDSATGSARLRIFKPTAVAGQYQVEAETAEESVAPGAAPTFPVDIPVDD